MKKAVLFLVVLLVVAFPATAQTKMAVAEKTDVPKLTDAQRENLRTLQVELQSVYLAEYQEKDRYEAAERRYDAQAQKIAAQLEATIKDVSKSVDPAKYVFNRGTLEFDPAPPAKTQDKK